MCTRVRDGLEVQREASWAWTPKCDLGVPGLPDVQKQVDEMRFSWPRWTGTLSLIGGTGKSRWVRVPGGKNWGGTRWQNCPGGGPGCPGKLDACVAFGTGAGLPPQPPTSPL